jgi:hypothetical protein
MLVGGLVGAQTAFNIKFTLRRSSALVGFFSGTFLMALETYGFLYRAIKNVVKFSRYATFLRQPLDSVIIE